MPLHSHQEGLGQVDGRRRAHSPLGTAEARTKQVGLSALSMGGVSVILSPEWTEVVVVVWQVEENKFGRAHGRLPSLSKGGSLSLQPGVLSSTHTHIPSLSHPTHPRPQMALADVPGTLLSKQGMGVPQLGIAQALPSIALSPNPV